VIKVPSRNRRGRVAADREPRLSAMRGVQVIRRSRTSHLGCHPARLESVGENFRPAACDREGQKHIVQLGIGVSLLSPPWAVLPCEILQACIAALVEAGTQVDKALRLLNQRGQDVRCELIDGKYLRQTVFGRDAPGLPVSDSCIVNHCIEGAECLDLFGHVAGLSDARQIAGDDCLRSQNGGKRFASSLLVTGMQNYAVPLLDQELCGHAAKPVGGTWDEHSRHYLLPLCVSKGCRRHGPTSTRTWPLCPAKCVVTEATGFGIRMQNECPQQKKKQQKESVAGERRLKLRLNCGHHESVRNSVADGTPSRKSRGSPPLD